MLIYCETNDIGVVRWLVAHGGAVVGEYPSLAALDTGQVVDPGWRSRAEALTTTTPMTRTRRDGSDPDAIEDHGVARLPTSSPGNTVSISAC